MRFLIHCFTAFLVTFLAACSLALADPEVHTTLSLHNLPQNHHVSQHPITRPDAASFSSSAQHQPMQAASEAGAAERPVGTIVVAVLMSGVLFGLGMGM
ncbi:hypothetical protein B5807_06627 [Epicoccum nigrum]|uniref:Transmembrane protein n=1 Tax=Epicoccum nigrum TaxID=105696 RepID=A0A1Y2LWD1_EPING|nr:hypothetical protein B5807_06627 [Epicoccum nigrum]